MSVDLYFTILWCVSLALILFFTLISKDKWGILTSVFILFLFGILRFHSVDIPASYVFEMQVGQKFLFRERL